MPGQLPLSLPGANLMPMGQASQLPIDTTGLIAGQSMSAPAPSPPPAAAGMMTGPTGAPIGAAASASPFPAPGFQPPWQVVLQPDGSSKYVVPTPGGDVTLGVNKAPVLPKALQAPTPASQATPAAA